MNTAPNSSQKHSCTQNYELARKQILDNLTEELKHINRTFEELELIRHEALLEANRKLAETYFSHRNIVTTRPGAANAALQK